MPLTAQQLANRKIGGSSVATILGVNPYQTPLELYYEMRGELTHEPENDATEAGHLLEDGIAALATRRMSRKYQRLIKLRRCNLTLVHPTHTWLTAHIDRDVVGEERLVELKNVGWRMAYMWGDEDTDRIPDYYLPQVHQYLLVKDYPVATVAAYFGGSDMRLFEVERDREMDEIIIEQTHDFYFRHVLAGLPPPVDYAHKTSIPLLKRIYPGTNGETIEVGPEDPLVELVAKREAASEAAKEMEKVKDLCTAELLDRMKDSAVLLLPDGSGFTRRRVDVEAKERAAYSFVGLYTKKAPKGAKR